MRYLTLLLALFCLEAGAAISFVAADNANNSSATSDTATEPTGTAQNDIVILFCSIKQNDGTWTDPTDFTEIDQQAWNEGDVYDTYIGYKIRGATAGQALTCTYSGTAAPISVSAVTYRGIDTTTPFDVTFSAATHSTSVNANTGLGPCPDITTNTNNAWVVCFQYFTDDGAWTAGASSGYTLDHSVTTVANRAHAVQHLAKATAGAENPPNWGHTDVAATVDEALYTLALKEASAGGLDAATLRRRR